MNKRVHLQSEGVKHIEGLQKDMSSRATLFSAVKAEAERLKSSLQVQHTRTSVRVPSLAREET